MYKRKRYFSGARGPLLILLALLLLVFAGWLRVNAPRSPELVFYNPVQSQPAPRPFRILNGKVASLNWIVGRDCQRSVQAYLETAAINPDAALVGTGWVDPTSGKLIDGAHNICQANSLGMDNVVRLVHSKGGMAYLAITMETDGSATSWTSQQQSDYIARATTDQGYIDNIVREVTRAGYDGVIMDLEGADANYPNIQQLFATYNQRIWAALKPLHKYYGIALLHKLSDHDEYYSLNGFENWSLLARSADFLEIMAVDQSYFTPGPTVSLPWLKQLLAYAMQTMPRMLPRTIWELPLYGATWRMEGGQWVFDSGVNYQDAQALISQIPASEIDAGMSDLNDTTSAHLVYTDTSGVQHSLWYPTARNLAYIISNFQQMLAQTPQMTHDHLMLAFWYRATWEPGGLWSMIDKTLPND